MRIINLNLINRNLECKWKYRKWNLTNTLISCCTYQKFFILKIFKYENCWKAILYNMLSLIQIQFYIPHEWNFQNYRTLLNCSNSYFIRETFGKCIRNEYMGDINIGCFFFGKCNFFLEGTLCDVVTYRSLS